MTAATSLLAPSEAAEMLGISESQLRALTVEGSIGSINVGLAGRRQTRRYEPSEIVAFKERRRTVPLNTAPALSQQGRRTLNVGNFANLEEIRAHRKSQKQIARSKS